MKRNLTENLGFARIDHGRERRKGFPEVIFAPGKTRAQILAIAERILHRSGRLLVTRTDKETYAFLKERLPELRWHAARGHLSSRAPPRCGASGPCGAATCWSCAEAPGTCR